MDGPALDRLSPPVAIQAARTGFIYRDRLVWGDMESLVHIRDASGEQVIEAQALERAGMADTATLISLYPRRIDYQTL